MAAQFSTAAGFAFHGFEVPPGAWVRTQTLQGYWWQHPVLALGLWTAWPLPTWRRARSRWRPSPRWWRRLR